MIEESLAQHREIEVRLDALLEAIRTQAGYLDLFAELGRLLAEHYAAEAALLERLAAYEPALAVKIAGQHAEVLEIRCHLQDAVDEDRQGDAARLVRRFHALAQHNIIEEERDVFPVAERCFAASSS